MRKRSDKLLTTRNIAKMAILGAVAGVLMALDVPIPFIAPSFYKIDFSEVAVLLGSFALGPTAGIIIQAIKILVNVVIKSSSTFGVGEVANFLTGVCLVAPAGWIYKNGKTKGRAVLGMALGTVLMTIFGALSNYYVLIPLYAKAYGWPVEQIVAMGTAINPRINSLWSLILLANVPFNMIKGALNGVITLLLYKRLSPILHK